MSKNIHYKTDEIVQYFSSHRDKWKEFYPSERWIFQKIGSLTRGRLGRVLDVGCACGGLGLALSEKFVLDKYVGIDINKQAIDFAKNTKHKFPFPCRFACGDILKARFLREKFDCVASLSCADWNVETNKIITACWNKVKPEGYFIISLRITPNKGINNIKKSYQHINYSGNEKKQEIANYVVFNSDDALDILGSLEPKPSYILGYGYWGEPSITAVTPFDKLVFTVFAVKKSNSEKEKTKYELHWPPELTK